MFTLEERKNYIGGSDIAPLMGLSRWKTPLKLWLEKTGSDQEDLTNNSAIYFGTKLEDFVAREFSCQTGKSVRKQSRMYIHPKYPFMVAHIDRLITGENELLECKTCTLYKKDEWDGDDIPQEYILQVMWYLGITGRKKGYIAVLIGGQNFKYKQIDFDQELFNVMVSMAKDFWTSVKTKTPPNLSATDGPNLLKMYPSHDSDLIEDSSLDVDILKLQKIKDKISELKLEQELIETILKNTINSHLGIVTDNYKVTWKEQVSSKINTSRLKEDGLYDKYLDQKSIRVLRVSKNK